MAGDSDMHEDEYIRVSMISVDESRRRTSEHIQKPLGMRDCVIAESGKQPDLSGYRDSTRNHNRIWRIIVSVCVDRQINSTIRNSNGAWNVLTS